MSRWAKQEDEGPMTDSEARLVQLEFNAEVARLTKIRLGNPHDRRLWGPVSKLDSRGVRYLDWRSHRLAAGLPVDLVAPKAWYDDL